MKNQKITKIEIAFRREYVAEVFLNTLKSNYPHNICIEDMQNLIILYLSEIVYFTKFSTPTDCIYGWIRDIYENLSVTKDIVHESFNIILPLPTLLSLDSTEENEKEGIPNGINDGGERISYGENMAVREPSTGKGRFDLITPFGLSRLARWYELGAQKYSDRNWEKGIPFSRYFDSAMRHMNKYMIGMTDEDHLAAACWNLLAIMHHEELGEKHLDDLPHYYNHLASSFEEQINKIEEMENYQE